MKVRSARGEMLGFDAIAADGLHWRLHVAMLGLGQEEVRHVLVDRNWNAFDYDRGKARREQQECDCRIKLPHFDSPSQAAGRCNCFPSRALLGIAGRSYTVPRSRPIPLKGSAAEGRMLKVRCCLAFAGLRVLLRPSCRDYRRWRETFAVQATSAPLRSWL